MTKFSLRRCYFLITLIFASPTLFADPLKVVYQLNEMEKTPMTISSINELLRSNPDVEIVAVIHGPAIIRLSKDDGLKNDFGDLLSKGVEIGACNNSILKNKFPPELLLQGVTVLYQGGVNRILELQQQGYLYIKI